MAAPTYDYLQVAATIICNDVVANDDTLDFIPIILMVGVHLPCPSHEVFSLTR